MMSSMLVVLDISVYLENIYLLSIRELIMLSIKMNLMRFLLYLTNACVSLPHVMIWGGGGVTVNHICLLTPSVFHYYLFFHNEFLFIICKLLYCGHNSSCTSGILYSEELGLYFFFDL